MIALAENLIQTPSEGPSNGVRRSRLMIDLAEAVRRVLVSEHYDGKRTAEAARSWLRRLAASIDDPELARRDDGRVWLHPSIHPAVGEPVERQAPAGTLLELPEGPRNRVLAKVQALQDLTDYRRRLRLTKTDARERFASERATRYTYTDGKRRRTLRLTTHALATWAKQYERDGADGLAADGRGRYEREQPSPDAVHFYWRFRNDPRKYAIAWCHRVVAEEAQRRGWRWFRTVKACTAWDQRTRDDRALVLNQEGDLRYQQRCGRYHELEPESYEPGECWVGDDHTLNVWVKRPDGKVIRPVLSVWQDWRSRMVGGWCMVPDGNEHSLLKAFTKFADQAGSLPATVIADNGKNFTSWQWSGGKPRRRTYRQPHELSGSLDGIFALLSIRPSWALPYNPNGKARLERWFRTLDDQFCKAMPSYCGKSPDTRPAAHKLLVDRAVEWDTFIEGLAAFVDAYNDRPPDIQDMNGYTPRQVMALATRKRVLSSEEQRLLLSSHRRPVKIGRNGVGVTFCGETVRYGWDEPALCELPIGTEVRVSFDPEDTTYVDVWTMDYRYIVRAARNQQFNRAIPTEAMREAARKIRREKRILTEAAKLGASVDHLRTPSERAVAALNRDSAERRKPDPPPPDGGPVLVPVRTPIDVPDVQRVRKAAGAENMDVQRRFTEYVETASAEPKRKSIDARLIDWARREGRQ